MVHQWLLVVGSSNVAPVSSEGDLTLFIYGPFVSGLHGWRWRLIRCMGTRSPSDPLTPILPHSGLPLAFLAFIYRCCSCWDYVTFMLQIFSQVITGISDDCSYMFTVIMFIVILLYLLSLCRAAVVFSVRWSSLTWWLTQTWSLVLQYLLLNIMFSRVKNFVSGLLRSSSSSCFSFSLSHIYVLQ